MNDQLSLTYRPAYTGLEAWELQLDLLRKIVEHLSRKEVSWELKVTDQALGDALFERDRKRWAAKWTHVVKAMLARRYDEVSVDLLQRLCESDLTTTSLVVGEPQGLTPEQENAELRREMARLEGGKAAIDRVKAKGKRK